MFKYLLKQLCLFYFRTRYIFSDGNSTAILKEIDDFGDDIWNNKIRKYEDLIMFNSDTIYVTSCSKCHDHYQLTNEVIGFDGNNICEGLNKAIKFISSEHTCLKCHKKYKPTPIVKMPKFVLKALKSCKGA